MKELPKVKKSIGSGLSKKEKTVRGAVLGATMALGIGLAAGTPERAEASIPAAQNRTADEPALLLTPPELTASPETVAYHMSHRSHYSHYSHQSHRSHYSHYSGY